MMAKGKINREVSLDKGAWVRIIELIDKPLGFFVLALLIVETFLGIVLVSAKLSDEHKIYCVLLGVGMFIIVIVLVFLLVWKKPEALTFDKDAHLIKSGIIPYGTESKVIKDEDLRKMLPQTGPEEKEKEVRNNG
jgi:hypothetical protein